MKPRRLTILLLLAGAVPSVHASEIVSGVVETEDREDWIAWVGEFDVVDFVGFADGTLLFDQYADLGVLFTDGNDTVNVNQLYLDGFGAFGGSFGDVGLTMVFDEPQFWIGLDYPGTIQFQLFREGELIHESREFDAPRGDIGFAGLISTEPFDTAVVFDPGVGSFIDNVYFGGVPTPVTGTLFALAALLPLRRRRQ